MHSLNTQADLFQRSLSRIPTPSSTVNYLLQAVQDEQIDIPKLVEIIERVPAIGMRLIGLANSAWSAPVQPITALDQACSRLGLQVVRSVSVALSLSSRFNSAQCPEFSFSDFWGGSLMRAQAAALLADPRFADDVATTRTAGLLSNLGLLWLADSQPQQTSRALINARECSDLSVTQALLDECGIGLDQASHALAVHWKLPQVLQNAIANQYQALLSPQASHVERSVAGAVLLVRAVSHEQEIDDSGLSEQQGFSDLDGVYAKLTQSYVTTMEMAKTVFSG